MVVLDQVTDKDIARQSIKMARFIHSKKIGLVIVGGASAQTAAVAVKEALNMIYPGQQLPRFVAIGALELRTKVTLQREGKKEEVALIGAASVVKQDNRIKELQQQGWKIMQTNVGGRGYTTAETKKLFDSEILAILKQRIGKITAPPKTMILEEYTESLGMIKRVKQALHRIGVANPLAGALSVHYRVTSNQDFRKELQFIGVKTKRQPNIYSFRRIHVRGLLFQRDLRATRTGQDKISAEHNRDSLKQTLRLLREKRDTLRGLVQGELKRRRIKPIK